MVSKDDRVYIAGHNGMVGSACWRALENAGFTNLIGKTSCELDLRDKKLVRNFIKSEKPKVVIDAAAKVGGILANDNYPYEFLIDNMQIQNNLILSSHENDVSKFIFLGSSCIYPKFANQPLKEEYILTGPLETTNQSYAIAKISGIMLIESLRKQYNRDYISLLPTNLYGPNDNFDLKSSHVIPALIRKFHDAKVNNSNVVLWGSGNPMREFLHVDDLASAILFCLDNQLKYSLYNIGYGTDIQISDLATLIKKITKFKGKILWNKNMPDGTLKKLLDCSRIHELGWNPKINFEEGIVETYRWFKENLFNVN